MNKNRIKLTESQLHGIIKKTVKNVLNESMYELKVPFEKAVNGIDEFLDALEENGYMEDEEAKKLYETLMNAIFAIKDLEVIEARSSSNNPNHLCLNLVDNSITATKNKYGKLIGKEIWAWNKMNEYKDIGEPKKIHLIGKLEPDFRNPKFYTFSIQTIIPA